MKTVTIIQAGYGQWTVSTLHYGKVISMHFTDSTTIDLIKSEERGHKTAIKRLRQQIIHSYNLGKQWR